MDFQVGFNVAMALLGALGGWYLKSTADSIKALHAKDEALTAEVHEVHLLVAGNYVKKDELQSGFDAVFAALRRIEDKMDKKADK